MQTVLCINYFDRQRAAEYLEAGRHHARLPRTRETVLDPGSTIKDIENALMTELRAIHPHLAQEAVDERMQRLHEALGISANPS